VNGQAQSFTMPKPSKSSKPRAARSRVQSRSSDLFLLRELRLQDQLRNLSHVLQQNSSDPVLRQIAMFLEATINRYRIDRVVEQL